MLVHQRVTYIHYIKSPRFPMAVIPWPRAGEGGSEGQQCRGAQHGHVRGERHAAQASVPGIEWVHLLGNITKIYEYQLISPNIT